jgi:hypothetical protein
VHQKKALWKCQETAEHLRKKSWKKRNSPSNPHHSEYLPCNSVKPHSRSQVGPIAQVYELTPRELTQTCAVHKWPHQDGHPGFGVHWCCLNGVQSHMVRSQLAKLMNLSREAHGSQFRPPNPDWAREITQQEKHPGEGLARWAASNLKTRIFKLWEIKHP